MGATATKMSVWVTLADLTGPDSICLSIASPGNTFSTCLVSVPLDAWPIPSALTSVVPPHNGTVTDMWDLWTVQPPLAQLEPQKIELLDSIPKDFCLFFDYTKRNQTHAWSVNTLNIIDHNASVTENLGIKSHNTNVVLKGRHSLLQHWMHGG